ncbi:hypothetical protein AB0F17_42730 [Nonomuraea sp. NPDC026600]|uniref:hypothetical protein n=1 Tax=Nonomuraea sp. NPDC026600 TaxID=3155363 RepID=UPI0033EF8D7F
MLTIADLIAESGFPATTPVKSLPGLTWHVTRPLEQAKPSITTIGDLTTYTDAELLAIPLFGAERLKKLRAALS